MILISHQARRRIYNTLKATLLAGVFLPLQSATAVDERRLSFLHTHTSERISVSYRRGEEYLPAGLSELDTFLSDFRNGKSISIDPQLLDLLYDIRAELGGKGTYEVISAYRSPETNEMLRNRSGGVAKNSLHMHGQAIDIRLTDVALERLRDTAIAMQRGGVGYYASSNFIHVDTGRVRRW
ncbi:MAG: YcbK family protein [Woeseiaceae bacterium]